MPSSYPGLGLPDLVPILNPALDAAGLALTPEDFFVLTRVDGKTSFREVVLSCGLAEGRAIDVLAKLRRVGAIHLPGEQPPRVAPREDTSPGARPPSESAENSDLTPDQQRAIIDKESQMRGATPRQILEVAADADRRAIKLAYFRLSKEFHPDRYFGKRLGALEARLGLVFEGLAQAFATLNAESRPPRTDVSPEHARAAAIFDAACQDQVSGDISVAVRRFGEAIALAPATELPRYLRRAAEAALAAGELRSAEEYVKKNIRLEPQHAGAHRILAKVYRALGRSQDARRALEEAGRLDPGNPHIARELQELGRAHS